eukprot:CAMPEP_0119144480 /NCGR_PEP_ID=MMETSP1310-20130426/35921_1 /TAXON_ID=464262 /ORGANISM="Genus nov. species nov., Strain RCC2339" /LENGTH=361 /DNA_ID=CAMNT_0007136225 /DNA_START=52 /DNA_END=1134 /DNA_ORIENTATION=-
MAIRCALSLAKKEKGVRTGGEVRVLIVGDTHLLGPGSNPIDRLRREWAMQQGLGATRYWLDTPYFFLLGDVFDVPPLSQSQMETYMGRFSSIFWWGRWNSDEESLRPASEMKVLIGNHDSRGRSDDLFAAQFGPLSGSFYVEGEVVRNGEKEMDVVKIPVIFLNTNALSTWDRRGQVENTLCHALVAWENERERKKGRYFTSYSVEREKRTGTRKTPRVPVPDCDGPDVQIALNKYIQDRNKATEVENNKDDVKIERPILLLHIPLFRPSESACSPTDVHKDFLSRFTTPRGRGYDTFYNESTHIFDYSSIPGKEVLDEDVTQKILGLFHPRYVFSAHTHYFCGYEHPDGTKETSVSTVNW